MLFGTRSHIRALAQVQTVYLNYFGLSEASFSITPDPQYLFLSEQHREALAHLLYGAGENGGFVMLTGEVGTGKTTICRAFLEQTPVEVDVALVLNPAMTAIELMHAICQEFGLAVPAANVSIKGLVDRLNAFLLDAHARGRHPVLMIDEAQNLCPRVLEQVRLLTNLETSKHKLLQIFLIGQPELREVLASPELRQLNQRITARFHLSPLSARETAAYVDHRIAIAGVERPLFTAAALREVYRRSRGVPRLINLICDRSLLGAAVTRRMQVSPAIVRRAARELLGAPRPAPKGRRRSPIIASAAAAVLALAVGAWIGASGLVQGVQQRVEQTQDLWAALQEAPDPVADAQEATANDAEAARAKLASSDGEGPAVGDEAAGELLASADAEAQDSADADGVTGSRSSSGASSGAIAGTSSGAVSGAISGAESAAGLGANSGSDAGSSDSGAAEGSGNDGSLASTIPDGSDAPARADGSSRPARAGLGPVGADDDDAVIPRIALARAALQVPEVAAADLPELTLDPGSPVPALVRRWGYEAEADVDCGGLSEHGLDCERVKSRWSDLRLLDRPAALRLQLDGESRYVLVTALDDEYAILQRDERLGRVPIATLDERWSGDVLMLWRIPPGGARMIGPGTAGEAVRWLREQLAALPDAPLSDVTSPTYDSDLREAVRAFQAGRGLAVDGIAGPRTLVMLNNALADSAIPRLSQSPTP